jgi:hypothetical protein
MEDFDMDADDPMEQENNLSPEKKPPASTGIAMDALHGLLDSYSTSEMKVSPFQMIVTSQFLSLHL